MRMDNFNDIAHLPVVYDCDVCDIRSLRASVFEEDLIAIFILDVMYGIIVGCPAGSKFRLVATGPAKLNRFLFREPFLKQAFCVFMILTLSRRAVVVSTLRCWSKVCKVRKSDLAASEDNPLVAVRANILSPLSGA
jgi:hypothetical protein